VVVITDINRVKPSIKCVTGKILYASEVLAEDALIEARTRFDYSAGHGPVAVYQCEDCGSYHLTSKGKMNERLADQLAKGSIHLQKEANRWLDKFKKK
jgi:hypothetical protein